MSEEEDRLLSGERREEDQQDGSLRPRRLDDFTGQKEVRENLDVFIKAASAREEAMDHVLFFGPPGWGKPHFRKSLPVNSVSAFAQHPAR